MTTIKAFILGLWESKSDVTTHFDNELLDAYDTGRAIGRFILGMD